MEGAGGDKATSQLIQTEACEVLTAGFDLFYPSPLKKAQFVLDLLNEEDSSNEVIFFFFFPPFSCFSFFLIRAN
jgi:hypothetical protein